MPILRKSGIYSLFDCAINLSGCIKSFFVRLPTGANYPHNVVMLGVITKRANGQIRLETQFHVVLLHNIEIEIILSLVLHSEVILGYSVNEVREYIFYNVY